MKTLHDIRPQCNTGLSGSIIDELPGMIQTIERAWVHQKIAGTYSFRQRLWLQQAHVALCSLVEFQEEAP